MPLLADDDLTHVTVPRASHLRPRAGQVVHRHDLRPDEMVVMGGVIVTSPVRTVCDLGRTLPLAQGVVVADDALRRGLVVHGELAYAVEQTRGHGVVRLRQVASLAVSNADSPPESLLRVALVLAGLGPVRVQARVGGFPHPYDLLLPWAKLLIEIDGWEFHGKPATWRADRRHGNHAHLADYALLRLGWEDVWPDPARALEAVVHAVSRQPGRRCRAWAARKP